MADNDPKFDVPERNPPKARTIAKKSKNSIISDINPDNGGASLGII